MNNEELLTAAELLADESVEGSPEQGILDAVRAGVFALVAIGRELVRLNDNLEQAK